MKKYVLFLLTISVFLFSGCGNESNVSQSTPTTESETPEAEEVEIKKEFPAYYLNLVAHYNNIAKENNLTYEHPVHKILHEEDPDSSFSYSYNFAIQSTKSAKDCETVMIYEKKDGTLIKSFKANFSDDFDNQTLKDFLFASISIANKNLSKDKALEDMQSLINSYDGKSISDLYQTDTYTIFLRPRKIIDNNNVVYMCYNEELNVRDESKNYTSADFDMISSPLNSGIDVNINATVISTTYAKDLGADILTVVDESGNEFSIYYMYQNFCFDFKENESYTFYGTITKDSGLRLDYFE
ncbi:hypothetical protein [Diplocloster hominis]|uniref:hypothetical protein n=1 Tax=Diplocloster hominis TaxID=3079010 RepID=UPI0031B9DDCE